MARGVRRDLTRQMEEALARGEHGHVGSVVVGSPAEVLYEAYFEGTDESTLRNTRSATKTVAGMLAGIAIDKAFLISEDDTVVSYLPALSESPESPESPESAKQSMTVRDLLTMSSCLDCNDDDPASPGNEEGLYEADDWLRFAVEIPTREERDFSYCTAGLVMLGAVLEAASGRPVPEFARQELFEPLEIEGEQWFHSPTGQAFLGGGLELRSRDLLKLGQLYLAGGQFGGRRVVSEDWVKKSTRRQLAATHGFGYGYLWWLNDFQLGDRDAVPAFCMLGNGGNKVCVFPSLDTVMVITATNYNTPGMHQMTESLLTDYLLPAVAASA